MPFLQVLNCAGDINTCCSDFALARFLGIIQRFLNIIHIIVPILLMVALAIQFTQLMVSPDDKKKMKALLNKFIAAVVVFLLPTIVHVVINWVFSGFSIGACWEASNEIEQISMATENTYIDISGREPSSIITDPSEYDTEITRDDTSTSPSTGNGTILLIAGHAYPPYCNGSPNDCRGMLSSGYDETDQTRILVKLIKSELSALGVEADIANALMAGDSNQMNTSFYKECRNNTSLCNRFDWSRYKYVLEVHFNASSNGSAAGTQLVKKSSSYSTPVDQAIVNAVISNTGKRHYSDYVYSAFDIGYFMNLGIPITYLETEFYDNKSAMDNYSSKKEKIAKDIASAIKQYYG